MPTQLLRPRVRGPRLALTVLERHKVLRSLGSHLTVLPVLLALAGCGRLPAGDRERTLAICMLVMQAMTKYQSTMTGAQLLLAMPRDNTVRFKRQKSPYDFGEAEFKDHFR